MEGLFQWQAARIGNCRACGSDMALVGALEDDLASQRGETRLSQYTGEWHAGPLGSADRAVSPRLTLRWRLELRAAIAGAFKGDQEGAAGQRQQFVVGQRERGRYRPRDGQPPCGGSQLRDREVVALVEGGAWRDDAGLRGEKRLSVPWLGADGNQAGIGRSLGGRCIGSRDCIVLFHVSCSQGYLLP